MSARSTFESQVLPGLTRLRRRLRAYAVTGGTAGVFGYLFVAGCVQLLLDYSFRLPLDMRASLLAVILIGLVIVGRRWVWRPLRFPLSTCDMAHLIERRCPRLHSSLVSAVQFATGQVGSSASNSPQLVQAVIDRVSREVDEVPFDSVLSHERVRRSNVTIIGVFAIGTAAFLWQPTVMGLWFDRNVLLSDEQWPKRTTLVVNLPGGELTGARGDDLEVRARAEGVVPREVDIIYRTESGETGRETMIAVGERGFRHTFSRANEQFEFKLAGGDDETKWYPSRLADRPAVETVNLSVQPPVYTGIEPFRLPTDERAVEALTGSRVTLDARLNKAVTRAVLMAGNNEIAQAEGSGDAWRVTLQPTESKTYHFALRDALGLENKRPVRVSIRVTQDQAPRVSLKIVGAGEMITPQAVLPLEMDFSDTYGLAKAEMIYSLSREGFEPQVLRTPEFKAGMTKVEAKLNWPVTPLAPRPGELLSLSVRAQDFDDVSGPNQSESATATLRVVTTDELLLELSRREQEYRQEFERVIEEQERLRGQLLTFIRQLDAPDDGSGEPESIVSLERRQRQIAGQVNLIRQEFEQNLTELEINGLDTEAVKLRLNEQVIVPMTRLAKRDLVTAADLLRNVARETTVEQASVADRSQVEILAEMRRILENMVKWEGYQEAVTMLREILRLQRELNDETRQEMEVRGADIFDGS